MRDPRLLAPSASEKNFAWRYGKSSGFMQEKFSLRKVLDLFNVFDDNLVVGYYRFRFLCYQAIGNRW